MDRRINMKLIGYARVSTKMQELGIQRDAIEKYCKDNNHELVGIFEESISAIKTRSEWNKVIDNVKNNRIDGVIFLRSDRVARSLKHLLSIIEIFETYNVEMISISEPMFTDLTSPQGKLIVSIMGAINEFERNLLIMRVHEGQARAKIMGTRSGKPPHRPVVNINWDKYDHLLSLGVTKSRIAKDLGISKAVLYKYLKNRSKENSQ